MIAAVTLVHVLQHLLAVAVREVDVDVGRFLALLAQEPFEEQPQTDRVHRGDAETEAHRGVRRRAAPLAEHAGAAREAHDVPDDQEIAGEAELADDRELVRELPVVRRRARASPAFVRALLHEPREIFIGAHRRREGELRQRGLELCHAPRAALGDRERGAHAFGTLLPAARDLRRRLEIPLAVGPRARAHLGERALVAQRAEHIVHHARARIGVVHIVRDHPRDRECARDVDERPDERALLFESVVPAFDGDAAAEDVDERGGGLARLVLEPARDEPRHPAARAAREREQSARMLREHVERHRRLTARPLHARLGDEHGQIPVALAILGEQHQVCGARHFYGELGPHDAIDPRFARRLRERDDAAELVVIGERERAVAERLRARYERLGRRRTVQQRERGMAVEFDVLAQSYHPCTNHFPLSAYTSSSPRAEAPRQ